MISYGILFSTMIAYGVQMTIKVSDLQYVPGVKDQGQVYLKSVLWLVVFRKNKKGEVGAVKLV